MSFLKEKSNEFYIVPDVEEVSYPVHQQEMVVLEVPELLQKASAFGFQFPLSLKNVLRSYLQNK